MTATTCSYPSRVGISQQYVIQETDILFALVAPLSYLSRDFKCILVQQPAIVQEDTIPDEKYIVAPPLLDNHEILCATFNNKQYRQVSLRCAYSTVLWYSLAHCMHWTEDIAGDEPRLACTETKRKS